MLGEMTGSHFAARRGRLQTRTSLNIQRKMTHDNATLSLLYINVYTLVITLKQILQCKFK